MKRSIIIAALSAIATTGAYHLTRQADIYYYQGHDLFNADKETDWRFPPDSASGQQLKSGLENLYFQKLPKALYHDKK